MTLSYPLCSVTLICWRLWGMILISWWSRDSSPSRDFLVSLSLTKKTTLIDVKCRAIPIEYCVSACPTHTHTHTHTATSTGQSQAIPQTHSISSISEISPQALPSPHPVTRWERGRPWSAFPASPSPQLLLLIPAHVASGCAMMSVETSSPVTPLMAAVMWRCQQQH